MSHWKDLPESLDPRLRQLVVLLREHKDRSGLSIAALASRTGFSKSSWDRYLNGRATPPEKAIESLAQACDAQPAPLLELRELAAAQQGGPETSGPSASAELAGPQGVRSTGTTCVRQSVPWLVIMLSSVTTALVMMIGLMLLAPWENATRAAARSGNGKPYTGQVHPTLGSSSTSRAKSTPVRSSGTPMTVCCTPVTAAHARS